MCDLSSDVCSSDLAAAEGDGPPAGRVDPVYDVEKGGRACAVRPDDALNLAFLDVEIDSVEHDKAAETLLQPPNLEQPHLSAPLYASTASMENGNGAGGGRAI